MHMHPKNQLRIADVPKQGLVRKVRVKIMSTLIPRIASIMNTHKSTDPISPSNRKRTVCTYATLYLRRPFWFPVIPLYQNLGSIEVAQEGTAKRSPAATILIRLVLLV